MKKKKMRRIFGIILRKIKKMRMINLVILMIFKKQLLIVQFKNKQRLVDKIPIYLVIVSKIVLRIKFNVGLQIS